MFTWCWRADRTLHLLLILGLAAQINSTLHTVFKQFKILNIWISVTASMSKKQMFQLEIIESCRCRRHGSYEAISQKKHISVQHVVIDYHELLFVKHTAEHPAAVWAHHQPDNLIQSHYQHANPIQPSSISLLSLRIVWVNNVAYPYVSYRHHHATGTELLVIYAVISRI